MKSSALKLFFQAERETCNQMVASIRHQSQLFDSSEFSWFISTCLDPLMAKLDGQSNQITFPVAHAGFKHGLELASLNWLKTDAKKAITIQVWNELYLKIVNIVQLVPCKIFSETSNLFNRLISFDDKKPVKWLTLMSKITDELDTYESLQDVGVVCSWMVGLAHLRELALKKLLTLSPQIVRTLFDLSDIHDLKHHLDKLSNNRWPKVKRSSTQNNLPHYTVEIRIGRCDLLGGEFPFPPKVFTSNGDLFVTSGKLAWRLYADIFGSTLIPFDIDELKNISEVSNQALPFSHFNNIPELSDINSVSSVASLTDTVALTSDESFSVIILSAANTSKLKVGH